MNKLPFKLNHEQRYSIRKTTSSMKNRPTHSGQSTDTSKEILDNSFSNNITTTNSEFFVCKIGGSSARALEFFNIEHSSVKRAATIFLAHEFRFIIKEANEIFVHYRVDADRPPIEAIFFIKRT